MVPLLSALTQHTSRIGLVATGSTTNADGYNAWTGEPIPGHEQSNVVTWDAVREELVAHIACQGAHRLKRALMDMPSARATFRKVNGVQIVDTLNGRPTTSADLTNRFVVNASGGIDELGEADVLYRKSISEDELFNPFGIYRGINWSTIAILILATFVGFGFVTNTYAGWLNWQGYFMNLIGGKSGQWAFANLGVLFALIIGFFGQWLSLKRSRTNR